MPLGEQEQSLLHELVQRHVAETGSAVADGPAQAAGRRRWPSSPPWCPATTSRVMEMMPGRRSRRPRRRRRGHGRAQRCPPRRCRPPRGWLPRRWHVPDPNGFLRYDRQLPARRPVPVRITRLAGGVPAGRRGADPRAGHPLHGLRHPVLPRRLPAGQPHPGLERPGPYRQLGRRRGVAARHQQLPGVHRPALPGALRGGLRARHRRRPAGDHQAGRGGDRQPRVAARGFTPRAGAGAVGPVGRRGRLRARRPRRRPAAGPRRSRGDGVRARRRDRWPAPLRHPRLQVGEAAHRRRGWPSSPPRACASAPA